LGAAFAYEPRLLEASQHEVKQAVCTITLGKAFTEIGQHAVVEAWVVQLQGQGVFEIDAAAHRLGHLPIRQIEQEL